MRDWINEGATPDDPPAACDVCGAELGGYVEIEDPVSGETVALSIRCAGFDPDPDELRELPGPDLVNDEVPF